MSIYKSSDESVPTDTEAYYEAVASQEGIYLEEVEEELRAILIFGDPSPSRKEVKRSMSDVNNDPRIAESLDEQLNHAADHRRFGWLSTERRGGRGDAENDSNA